MMPFLSRLASLGNRLAAQCGGDLGVLAEMAVGERGVVRPQHPAVGAVHHEAHDLLGPGELPEPLGTGRGRARRRRKESRGNARGKQARRQVADDGPVVHDELTVQDGAGGDTDEDRDRENAQKAQQRKSPGHGEPATH